MVRAANRPLYVGKLKRCKCLVVAKAFGLFHCEMRELLNFHFNEEVLCTFMQHCTLSVCPVFKQSVYISKFVLFQFTLGCFNFGLMTTTYKSMKMCMLEKFVKCLYWLVNQILKNGKICPKNDPSRPHR